MKSAAVWARENTREAVFDAMERKETYATTGSRMMVRFFGGWDFDTRDMASRQPAFAGYSKGVPMGGELSEPEAGDRNPGNDGTLPLIGNTVDASTATWTNTIGASELGTVWTDPDFDPDQRAFYYARVLEIPTPRWSTIDAFRFGVPIPEGAPVSTQERAYTSPIWYTPE